MTVMRESRTEKRAIFDERQRIVLLEQDSDSFEELTERISRQLTRLIWVGLAGLTSFSTASILLAVDLAARN